MSEYWKSTPKYWCKHCTVYVRDTKLERSNHEATAKHQGALKRFLRDLHRGHDKEEREKDRAKREIERLNGVVGSSTSSAGPSSSTAPGPPSSSSQASGRGVEAQRQKQWEQLAEMGIDVPTELRGNMAMASEWQVTNTRVIDDAPKTDEHGNAKVEAVATGVRKRVKREGEEEEEEALQSLFKKPRKWGRDNKQASEDDVDLDALLSGTLVPTKKEKIEESADREVKEEQQSPPLKEELPEDDQGISSSLKLEAESDETRTVKAEQISEGNIEAPAVVFKKRKPKTIRQK
ncbi:u1 zinc finger [Seiridium cupressi]